jgi:hypothetical protein
LFLIYCVEIFKGVHESKDAQILPLPPGIESQAKLTNEMSQIVSHENICLSFCSRLKACAFFISEYILIDPLPNVPNANSTEDSFQLIMQLLNAQGGGRLQSYGVVLLATLLNYLDIGRLTKVVFLLFPSRTIVVFVLIVVSFSSQL